jgi:hypothetical protein
MVFAEPEEAPCDMGAMSVNIKDLMMTFCSSMCLTFEVLCILDSDFVVGPAFL